MMNQADGSRLEDWGYFIDLEETERLPFKSEIFIEDTMSKATAEDNYIININLKEDQYEKKYENNQTYFMVASFVISSTYLMSSMLFMFAT